MISYRTECSVRARGHPRHPSTNADADRDRFRTPSGDEFSEAVAEYGVAAEYDEGMSASTDFGNVTYQLPSLHPVFSIPTEPNGQNHTAAFTVAAATPEAHAAALVVMKGLAMAGFRVLDDAKFADRVQRAWREDMGAR